MVVLKQVESSREYKRIRRLYRDAFPREERAPFFLIRKKTGRGKSDLLDVEKDGIWIGFVCILCHADLVYISYFALDPDYRGKGYGREAVRAILDRYKGKRVFLALEDWREPSDNHVQRIQRHRFYERCGLKDLPYRLKEGPVVYAIMGNGEAVEPDEFRTLADEWLGSVMKHVIDMRILKSI